MRAGALGLGHAQGAGVQPVVHLLAGKAAALAAFQHGDEVHKKLFQRLGAQLQHANLLQQGLFGAAADECLGLGGGGFLGWLAVVGWVGHVSSLERGVAVVNASVSLPSISVYGELKGKADIDRQEQDVLDAAVQTAREFGSVDELAARIGVPANTLQHKLNPNNKTHHLQLVEAARMVWVTGLPYVLQAMGAPVSYVPARTRPDPAEGDPLEAFYALQLAHADLVAAAVDALRHGGAISVNEYRRIEYAANEAMAAINALTAAAAGRVTRREG